MPAKHRILVVDDEPDLTYFLKKALDDNGFETVTFNDPVQALAEYEADKFTMILLDIRMPKMDGFQLYDKIRKIDSKTKVCFMTAYEVYTDALKDQFPDIYESVCFIKKPFSTSDFIKRISKEMV